MEASTAEQDAVVLALERPHPKLLVQYTIRSLAGVFMFPVLWLVHYFKYHTLRYRFGEDGISASWGILFRQEVHLTYKRIQDIHVSRSIVERYLGLGTVEIQTAAGSSRAELTVEGRPEYEAVRDFLYRRMRGHEPLATQKAESEARDEARDLLTALRDELAATRRALESQR